ncbi:MAG: glycosyltransferase [Planctomycetes bacterium]|nr:glycosyltransferase [Planctomycetota bacterium]
MSMGPRTAKVDLHLHSYASNVTDYYAANTFAIPESYSDPFVLYQELKRRGMALVTLTDHNSIDGVKELLDAGLPDVFVSAEMTTTFPEDGCNIHVTVANMTEAQFAEVDRLRGNVYEMVDFVEREIASEADRPGCNRLAYWMTHPLMSTQNRPYGREGSLTADHIEKALLLFPCLEVRNGTRTRALNEFTQRLVTSLDRATIERLANQHDLAPRGPQPWIKAIVGGSDDHCGINHGMTWTELPVADERKLTPNDLVDALRARRTTPGGAHGGPVSLAHAVVKLLYDGTRLSNGNGGSAAQAAGAAAPKSVTVGGPIHALLRFVFDSGSLRLREKLAFQSRLWLQKAFGNLSRRRVAADRPFERILAAEASAMIGDKRFQKQLAAAERTDDRIFTVVSTLVNRIFQRYVARIRQSPSLDFVRVVKEVVALVSSNLFVSLPYLLSYLHQSSDRMIVRDVRKRFDMDEQPKLVLLTDTFFEINGVARTIRRMIDEAERRGIDFTVATCLGEHEREQALRDDAVRGYVERGRLKILPSIVNLDFPEYKGLQVRVPPFLELLKWLQESGFTKMQISTPGSIGIAGLLAAKLLQIETSSTYHTSFPEYVEDYTRDISLEALAWKYMILFYHSVDEVVVPSRSIARLLHLRGLRNRKLLILDRWVDTARFTPEKRDPRFWDRFGIGGADKVRFLYVGRVGLEKNLDVMAAAFERLAARHSGAQLVIVGDGPYRKSLEQRLGGLPVTFTGFLEGEELAVAYSSADVKLFPSTTDTWGNAPLEAQAAGLPVIVSDKGGPQELMVHGVTGFIARGRDVDELLQAMERLMDRPTRERLGRGARTVAVENHIDEPFLAIFDSERYRREVRKAKKDFVEPQPRDEEPVESYLVDHRTHTSWAAGA